MRAWLVVAIVTCYLILNEGFMLILIPPGSGIPFGEILILLFAACFVVDVRHLPAFSAVAPILALVAWWLLTGMRLAIDAPKHGFWTFRDALPVIESTFLWIGFVVAASVRFLDRFPRRLGIILTLAAIYHLLFPIRDQLLPLSPVVYAPAGYVAPVFFQYTSASLLPLTAAARMIVDRASFLGVPAIVAAGTLIVMCVVFHQARTTYLQVLTLLAFIWFLQPRTFVRLSVSLVVGIGVLAAVLASGVEITGRLGEKFDIEFLLKHFAAIWGFSSEGAVGSAASGNAQRIAWWTAIWRGVTADVPSLLFGLGYGIPLTDFVGIHGQTVREPHNSTVSMFGRQGVVGLALFAIVQLALARAWLSAYATARRDADQAWVNCLIVIAVFALLHWINSLGEDAFEKPFNAIPYYFLFGVVLRYRFSQLQGSPRA